MSQPRRCLFCLVASGLLAAITLVPWGALEVFEFKTVDVRMWVRELFHDPVPRTSVQTVVLDDGALDARVQGGAAAARCDTALERLAAAARRAGTFGLELPSWHSVATPMLERALLPWAGARGGSPSPAVAAVGLQLRAQIAGLDSKLPALQVPPLPEMAWLNRPRRQSARVSGAAGQPARLPAALRLGEMEFGGDHDGVVRKVPLVSARGGRLYPSFVLQAICAHDGADIDATRVELGRSVELRRQGRSVRRIPIDSRGRVIVNYRERTADATIPLLDLVQAAAGNVESPGDDASARRRLSPDERIVLLGTSARGVAAFENIPLMGRAPDVEVAAEALETILTGRYIIRVGQVAQYFITWALLFLGSLAMVRLPSWRSVLFGFGLVALYFVAAKVAFLWANVWLGFVLPITALMCGVAVFPVYGYRSRARRLLDELRLLRRFDDLILMNIAGGLIVAGRHGLVVRHNPRAAELLGLPGESMHGRHVRELFAVSPAMLELVGQAMAAASATEKGQSVSCRLPMSSRVAVPARQGGSERVMDLEIALVAPELLTSAEHGNLPCFVLTFDDVTADVQRAQEDERRARLAAMGEIAAKLGHEVRNSLGGLRLYVENVRDEIPPTGTGARAIESMIHEIESLYRKIEELRQYGGDSQLELSECDLKELLEEALAYSSRKLGEKHIRVVLDCDRQLQPITVDRRQLREAFQNLINNAIEAAPEGGRVSIAMEHTSSGNGMHGGSCCVHVEDNGPGIAPDIRDQVFSLFFTTKPDIGTGLGLPIVKKIVESHGGHVSFECDEEGGTRFTVTLPVQQHGGEVRDR
ncbi:MAG: ATP-binding protein [Candidatus Krumholzibacteriia bacterium]